MWISFEYISLSLLRYATGTFLNQASAFNAKDAPPMQLGPSFISTALAFFSAAMVSAFCAVLKSLPLKPKEYPCRS